MVIGRFFGRTGRWQQITFVLSMTLGTTQAGISLPTKPVKQEEDGSIPFNVWMMKLVKRLYPATGKSKTKALRSLISQRLERHL